MASAGRDKKVVVWDMMTKKPLVEQKCAEPMTALAWQPDGNCLASYSEAGEANCWQDVIPGDKASPSAALDTLDLAAPILGNTAGRSLPLPQQDETTCLVTNEWIGIAIRQAASCRRNKRKLIQQCFAWADQL